MPLTKHTESKLKKFKKEELISHIITLYDKISEGEAGSVPYYEHKELIEKYDKLKANADEFAEEIQKGLKEEKESLAETEKVGLAMLETNEQLLKSKEETLQHLKAVVAENDTLEQKHKDLLENTEHIWKQQKCAEDELKKVEELMSIFTDNGELPGGEMGCLGCRITRYSNFTTEWMRSHKKLTEKLVAVEQQLANPVVAQPATSE